MMRLHFPSYNTQYQYLYMYKLHKCSTRPKYGEGWSYITVHNLMYSGKATSPTAKDFMPAQSMFQINSQVSGTSLLVKHFNPKHQGPYGLINLI